MALPPLYKEGLLQHARRGLLQLHEYKLGMVEALLKDVLRRLDSDVPAEGVRDDIRTALDVILWEKPPPWRET
jgi:hypothetical protein